MMRRIATLHPLQRAALVVWGLMLLGIAGRVALSKPRSQTVVPIYLNAAQRWLAGADLYVVQWPLDIYRNPPGFAAAFTPLTLLPERLAGIVWRGIGAAVFLLGLRAWVRYGAPRDLTPAELGAVFLLAAPLALPSLNNGQTNLHTVGLLLLGVTAMARGHGVAAGLWLAAAAAVKVYPLAVGLLAVVAAPRRVLPWLAAFCALFLAVPFLFQDSGYVLAQYRSLAESTQADDRTFANLSRAPKDLYLVLRVWIGPPSPAAYKLFTLVAAGLMAGFVAFVARRTGDLRACAALALHLGCVWMTVLGPATEVHTYTLLAPTAAAVVVLAAADRHRSRLGLATIGYALLVAPIARDMFPNGTPFHALGPQPMGGLLVLAAVVWGAIPRRREPAGEARVVAWRQAA